MSNASYVPPSLSVKLLLLQLLRPGAYLGQTPPIVGRPKKLGGKIHW